MEGFYETRTKRRKKAINIPKTLNMSILFDDTDAYSFNNSLQPFSSVSLYYEKGDGGERTIELPRRSSRCLPYLRRYE